MRWRLLIFLAAVTIVGNLTSRGGAQTSARQSSPLSTATGTGDDKRAADQRRVLVRLPADSILAGRGDATAPVVARLHHEADGRVLVILPSGELIDLPANEATPTDRPFVPATKDELASALTAGKFKDFKTKQTKRFLYVYSSSDLFYQGTSRILETMYPGVLTYCKKQKLDAHEAELPLVIVMFRTKSQFDRFRKMPDGVVAYYDGLTNAVYMYEMSQLAAISADIALKQAVSTVAHEGVHQILMNIGVQQRLSRWPMWISEGLPEFFAPTDITRDVRWKGVAMVNDLRMAELEHYIKTGGAKIEPGETMRTTAIAQNLTSTGYASAWALTHFLAQKRPADFPEFLQEVSRREPLVEYKPDDDLQLFSKHFGTDYATLEALELKHLKGLPYVNPLTVRGLKLGK
ncbi:MAG TPA: DUF1570 domain-containing protein [Pirellulales bacterium]|jgi:hypothetical protein|nr:DUF1570 domain-containing protein [Pirellulales bacterium]